MLADKGVYCIDEFDKIDKLDQTAVHEAMKQQQMIIAKAGIQTTLNARAGILAAANLINGRYDNARPLQHTASIPAPITPQFNQFFVIVYVGECDETSDIHVTFHIVPVHRGKEIDTSFKTESLEAQIDNGSDDSNNSDTVTHTLFKMIFAYILMIQVNYNQR